jgi:DNA-binding Lrp family transcriptional regulator
LPGQLVKVGGKMKNKPDELDRDLVLFVLRNPNISVSNIIEQFSDKGDSQIRHRLRKLERSGYIKIRSQLVTIATETGEEMVGDA